MLAREFYAATFAGACFLLGAVLRDWVAYHLVGVVSDYFMERLY